MTGRKRSSIFDVVSTFHAGRRKRPSTDRSELAQQLGSVDEGPSQADPFYEPPPAPLAEYIVDAVAVEVLHGRPLSYCSSKRFEDVAPGFPDVTFGSTVVGRDCGDGWLACGDVFLPLRVHGVVILKQRQLSKISAPRPKKWVRKPWPPPPPAEEEDSEVHSQLEGSDKPSDPQEPQEIGSPRGSVSETGSSVEPVGRLSGRGSLGSLASAASAGTQRSSISGGGGLSKLRAAVANMAIKESDTIEKMPVESRLPVLEPSHWLAPGGMRAPHGAPRRKVADDLQEAVMRGDLVLVRRLIEAGVSVNAPIRTLQDEEFLTLLHILACRPCIANGTRILVELLKQKANPNTRSSKGATPLLFACLHKHVGAVEVLLEFGADASPVDDDGRSAVRCAMIPDPEVPESEELAVELAELLSAAGADMDLGGRVAPIVEAVSQHNGPAVKALIRLGVTPDGLLEAVFNAPVSIIQDLLEAEANPFVRDAEGKTVMEIALGRGEEQVTTMLRDYIGNLERGNHPHLLTRTVLGPQDWIEEMNLRGTVGFEPKEGKSRKDGERKSLADRIIEQHLLHARPLSKRDKMQLFAQKMCKTICRTYTFQTVMIFALCLALFLPDLWVVANITTSEPLDVMIIILFVAFSVEFTLQCIGFQKAYIFKFTFWMDILGWWSVPLDHSLVTSSILASFQGSVDGPTLARLTKLVKLGARAGRMSRLVKLLRFLPGMGDAGQHAGTAAVMSKLINMRISIQVAAVIIGMVIVLPLMDISRFPQVDNSMLVWARLIDQAAVHHPDELGTMVQYMQEFYAPLSYHPYRVNLDYPNGTGITMDLSSPPKRRQDSLTVRATDSNHTASLIFDFRGPSFVDALCSVLLMLIIVIVIFAAAILVSTGVTNIVLRPLERLLGVVKEVAGTIFASVDNLARSVANKNKQDDADSDVEEGNEAKMLERVLKKLTALSELTVKRSPIEGFEDLSYDEKAMLSDYNVNPNATDNHELKSRQRLSVAAVDRGRLHEAESKNTLKLMESGLSFANFMEWHCDVTDLSHLQRESLGMCLVHLYEAPLTGDGSGGGVELEGSVKRIASSQQPQSSDRVIQSYSNPVSPSAGRRKSAAGRRGSASDELAITVANVVMAIASSYTDDDSVPYHTYTHALDVTLTLHHVMRAVHAENYFTMSEMLGLIVAGLAHDMGHGGVDNRFLVQTEDPLALLYNDQSPLENMHCARLFEITSRPGCTIFQKMEPAAFRELRSVCVEAILGTDIAHSAHLTKELVMTYEMKADTFDSLLELYEKPERLPPFEVVELFSHPDQSSLLKRFFLHFCDMSFCFRTWKTCFYWGDLMVQEFWHQGDREEELGIPVGYLFDRRRCSGPRAMISIIEFCVTPLCVAARSIFPQLLRCEEAMLDNLSRWAREWEAKASPPEEEARTMALRRGVLRREQKDHMHKLKRRAARDRDTSEAE